MPKPDTRGPAGSARKVALWGAVFAVAAVYLFATRPAPLDDGRASQGTVPIEKVFRILAAENDAARAMWTVDIVGTGVKAGLKFNEKWRQPDIEAGPLPALFLRESATAVQKTQVPLGLFLGSDYPIAPANRFTGEQAEHFKRVRATGNPEFFQAADIGRSTAMFADFAVGPACVSCHNQHPNSPKTDWKLKDMMGATTWSYPKDKVTIEEALQIVGALRTGFAAAYDGYLAKVATFEKPPELGERWPRDGYYLPTRAAFMGELERRASAKTVQQLLHVFEKTGSP
jgi:adenylate cyclase